MVCHAEAAAALIAVFAHVGALAEAFFRNAEDVFSLCTAAGADHYVVLTQADAAHADCRTAHDTHVTLREADGKTVAGGDHDVLVTFCRYDGNELVTLVEGDRPDADVAQVLQRGLADALDRAVFGDEEQVLVLLIASAADHGADLFVLIADLDGQDVHDVRAAGIPSRFGDLVALAHEDAALRGKEQDVVMCGGGEDRLDVVLFLCRHGAHALAAAALGTVLADRQTLDIAAVGQGKDALFFFDQILNVDLIRDVLDLGLAFVAELVADGDELILQDALDLLGIGQQFLIIRDLLFQLPVFFFQLFPVESLQLNETHVADGLGLDVGEAEALHQVLLCVVVAGTNDADDLVDVVLCEQQALQQMCPLFRLFQIIAGSADDQVLLEGQIFVQNVPQRQNLRLGLVLDQGQHVDGEAGLQRRLGKEAVQDHLGIGVALEFDDDAHAVAVGLIAQVRDAIQALFVDLVGNVPDELPLVHLIGQLRHDDAGAVLAVLLKFRSGPQHNLAAAR